MPELPPGDADWDHDKQRFVADASESATSGQAPRRDHRAPLGPLAQQFATLTYSLLDADTVGDVLQQIVNAAWYLAPGADVVSVTLRSSDGQLSTPTATDPIAQTLERAQHDLAEGPCLSAIEQTGPALALSHDLTTEARWPRFAALATEHGIAAVCSTAVMPATDTAQLEGALNIYARQPHQFNPDLADTALLLATHASLALAHTHAVTRAHLQTEHLQHAIDSRDVLGQAKGILMSRRGLDADEAFDLLRRTSQDLNVKLITLAETLTQRHTELDLPEQPTDSPNDTHDPEQPQR